MMLRTLLGLSCLTLLAAAAACESTSSGGGTTPPGPPGSDGGTVAIKCVAPTGAGKNHSDPIKADETWTATVSGIPLETVTLRFE